MRVALIGEQDAESTESNSDGLREAGEPLLLTAKDLARVLRIGRSKAFEMMAKGELPTVRFGRSVRVPRHALYSWIEARTAGVDLASSRHWWQ